MTLATAAAAWPSIVQANCFTSDTIYLRHFDNIFNLMGIRPGKITNHVCFVDSYQQLSLSLIADLDFKGDQNALFQST